jgi:hypothetical protein
LALGFGTPATLIRITRGCSGILGDEEKFPRDIYGSLKGGIVSAFGGMVSVPSQTRWHSTPLSKTHLILMDMFIIFFEIR